MKGYVKYFSNKAIWFLITLVAAFLLNFILPRLMPGDPVAAIVARQAQGMSNTAGVQAIYDQYAEQFGTNKPMLEQFILYVQNVFHGDFGYSFSQYPRTVADVIRSSIGWTIGLQLPAIIVGWILGNVLGVLAAYRRGVRQGSDARQPLYEQPAGVWYGHYSADGLCRDLALAPHIRRLRLRQNP